MILKIISYLVLAFINFIAGAAIGATIALVATDPECKNTKLVTDVLNIRKTDEYKKMLDKANGQNN